MWVRLACLSVLLFATLRGEGQSVLKRPEPVPEVLADRVSMAMRGLPASPQDRAQLASEGTTVEGLAESYVSDPAFQDLMTQFWLEKLGIDSRISFEDTMIPGPTGTAMQSISQAIMRRDATNHPRVERVVYLNQPKAAGCRPRLEMLPGLLLPPTDADYKRVESLCNNMTLSATERQTNCNTLNQFKSRIDQYAQFSKVHQCACGSEIDVKPFWDISLSLKACPSVVRSIKVTDANRVPAPTPTELCGTDLRRCQPYDPVFTPSNINFPAHLDMSPQPLPGGSFLSDLAVGVTQEPGRLIAAVIADRGDFRSVLTDTRTRLNGAMEGFYLSPLGQQLLAQLPPGTFREGPSGAWRLNPAAGMRKTFRWIDRGPGHAGVLTTWAFHQYTNGYRAKANRVYEAFLCQRFVIPPGTLESNIDSDDLLVRQPCASCHEHVEPMGAFFNKWAREGTNYIYNPAGASQGRFLVAGEWKEGEDTRGLGAIVASDRRFAECAATRAFEFIMSRGPTPFEQQGLIAAIATKLSEDFNFVNALTSVVASDSFWGGNR